MWRGVLGLTAGLLLGCSSEDGDRDLAGAVTGPAIETHCAALRRQDNLDRFPTGVGSTSVTVNCAGATP